MRTIKIVGLFIAFLFTISLIYKSCEEGEENKNVESSFDLTTITYEDAKEIGKLHNVFVERAFDYYLGDSKSKGQIDNLDLIELVDFFSQQPESEGISNQTIEQLKLFFCGFATDEESEIPYEEQFLNYVKDQIEVLYGVSYEDIISNSKQGVYDSKRFTALNSIAVCVYSSSKSYWTDFYPGKTPGTGIIAGDTAGAIWGAFFGGVGSAIVGGIVSMVLNEVENGCGGPVFDGMIHTPKDC